MDLPHRWPIPNALKLRDELLAAYAHPSRGYHDTRHLGEVLARLDELADSGIEFDESVVRLAAWFHDAVYDGERDAEERSATWAELALPDLAPTVTVEEVARLVRMTETHRPEDDDTNGCALSDADLAILASGEQRYGEYVAAVRREFTHLADAEFNAGRAQVLRGLAEKDHLFHTGYAQQNWESDARANLERELAQLQA